MCWYAGRGLDVQANKAAHLSVCPCTCLASSPTETVGAHQRLSASLSRLTWIYQTPLVLVQQRRPVLPSPAAVLDGSRGGAALFLDTSPDPLVPLGGCEYARMLLITLCIRGLLQFYAPFHADSCHCDQLLSQTMTWSYFVRTYIKIWLYVCDLAALITEFSFLEACTLVMLDWKGLH